MGSVAPIAQSEATTTTADADTVGERDSNELLSSVDHISAVAEDTSHSGGGEPNAVAELTGEDRDEDQDSCYWDASTMAPFNPASAAAIARLRAFKPPPFPLWDRLPVSRRAAVLLLLYADRRGDLRVVITMRAASLRSFSGHAALPGGKADSLEETPYQIARREAWEEIGLPMDDTKLPPPFRIEHLCYLPLNLARTELVVRPCVALLHTTPPPISTSSITTPNTSSSPKPAPTVEETLIPRLDAKEVAAVFSAPFHNFLRAADEPPPDGQKSLLPPGKWYEGSWTNWHEHPWRMHFFHVPVTHQHVARPRVREGGLASIGEDSAEPTRYKVWGMTAQILVDAASTAYGERPEFEHHDNFVDERIIAQLDRMGRFAEEKKKVTDEDMRRAVAGANKGGEGGAKM